MKMPDIKTKAEKLGITPGNMKKPQLIHRIQVAEGNKPCYGTSKGKCPYTDCCFMSDCLVIK